MRFFTVLAILAIILAGESLAFSSETMQQIWDVPTAEVSSQTIKAYDRGKIRVEEIYYQSRPFKRNPVKIFGYFCYPRHRSGKLPAILLSHGGGGTASLPRAISWANHGYTVLTIDLPGKGENRASSRSTGPNMDVSILLRTQPDPSYNYLVHAVAAARNGITYLSRRREVDPNRIGMIGLSWGGVLTLLTNGQDNRLKAAVNVFGAGYIPEGCTWEDWFSSMPAHDKEIWNNYIDPKNFIATQNAPILFITGTNDHCYYLHTFQKSYEEVPVEKNYYLIPNLRHRFTASAADPALAWLDYNLKGGKRFPRISLLTPFNKGADKIIIPARVKADCQIKSVRLYYTLGGPHGWTAKLWKTAVPYQEGELFYFAIPADIIKPDILFYASAVDVNGGVSSSLVKSLFAVKFDDGRKTFAVSSPIKKLYRKEPPFTLLNGIFSNTIRFVLVKTEKVYKAFNI